MSKFASIHRGLLVALLGSAAGAAELRGDLQAHDPSTIIHTGGRNWLFYTGPGCKTKSSADLITWRAGASVFPKPLAWWSVVAPGTNKDVWAPDIVRVGERYYLYYCVSVLGKNTSAIGLASNVTLDPADSRFRWIDEGVVIQTKADDLYNALDPAPLLDTDGRLWLVFGSYWTGIKMIELDPRTGKRLAPNAPLYHLAAAARPRTDIEAAYLYKHGDWYYLFVNRGQCCQGVRSTYEVRIGRSRTTTGPYVDRAGADLLNGGGSVFLKKHDRFIGPGHVGILQREGREWCSYHFYDATHNGQPTLRIEPLTWDADGWPRTINEDQQKVL